MHSDPLPDPNPTRPAPPRWPFLAATVAAVVVVAGALWLYRSDSQEPLAVSGGPITGTSSPTPQAAEEPEPTRPPRVLPALADSDALVRELAAALAARPELATWLAEGSDWIRRGVAAVLAVSEGKSPRPLLSGLAPKGAFTAAERNGQLLIDPSSYRRYDQLTAVVAALDVPRTVGLLAELAPLLDEAFGEIAFPGSRFIDTLHSAIDHLLATPQLGEEVEVVNDAGVYRFADPQLEGLSAAQKHLLRFGPGNGALVRGKLGELAAALPN